MKAMLRDILSNVTGMKSKPQGLILGIFGRFVSAALSMSDWGNQDGQDQD